MCFKAILIINNYSKKQNCLALSLKKAFSFFLCIPIFIKFQVINEKKYFMLFFLLLVLKMFSFLLQIQFKSSRLNNYMFQVVEGEVNIVTSPYKADENRLDLATFSGRQKSSEKSNHQPSTIKTWGNRDFQYLFWVKLNPLISVSIKELK